MNFSGFHIWEVVVAALSSLLLGYVWYHPKVFGKNWLSLQGDSPKSHSPITYLLAYMAAFLIALLMSFFIEIAMMLQSGAIAGAAFGLLLSIFFVATSFGINYLFSQKPLKLYFIDAGYMVMAFVVMGAIMGAWA